MTDTSVTPTPATVAASALTSDRAHLPAASLSRVTPRARERAAERGEAMKDGSFPIRDGMDLRRAIRAFGRAKDKSAAKRHIIRRARALDKISLLPDAWQATASREFPNKRENPMTQTADLLQAKVTKHNAETPVERRVSVPKAKVVYQRGVSAFSARERPGITCEQYAHARVNAFLHMLSAGAPRSPLYIDDRDLLPKTHPLAPPPFSLTAAGKSAPSLIGTEGAPLLEIEWNAFKRGEVEGFQIERLGESSSDSSTQLVFKLTHPSGKTFIIKKCRREVVGHAEAERDVSMIMRSMGIPGVPEAAISKVDADVVIMNFAGSELDLKEVKPLKGEGRSKTPSYDEVNPGDPQQLIDILMVDSVLENRDRATRNILIGITKDNKRVLLPIDHGACFNLETDGGEKTVAYHVGAPQGALRTAATDLAEREAPAVFDKRVKTALDKLEAAVRLVGPRLYKNRAEYIMRRIQWARKNMPEILDEIRDHKKPKAPETIAASVLVQRDGGWYEVTIAEAEFDIKNPAFERLHPRGRDGRFIHKNGIIKLFLRAQSRPGVPSDERRAGALDGRVIVGRVAGIQEGAPGQPPFIEIDRLDGRGRYIGLPADIEQSEGRARLDISPRVGKADLSETTWEDVVNDRINGFDTMPNEAAGVNPSYWLKDRETGKRYLYKRNDAEDMDTAEIIGAEVLQEMNYPGAPIVAKPGTQDDIIIHHSGDEHGTSIIGTPGAILIDIDNFADADFEDILRRLKLKDELDIVRMTLFDALMGNTDRHEENWLIGEYPDGTRAVHPIDHGLLEGKTYGGGQFIEEFEFNLSTRLSQHLLDKHGEAKFREIAREVLEARGRAFAKRSGDPYLERFDRGMTLDDEIDDLINGFG